MVLNTQEMQRKSSAVTLSDMEMFIFPELIYSLVLANIMSPRIWRWRDDPWFAGLERMKPYRRISRLKQFIMNNYAFNLDLDTWGLTTKEQELARFADFIDEETLARSNALFGYEGDRYYFDIDIRTHFGLDNYQGNVIPYWKTETVEAMDAFRHKPDYTSGAGECVSLAALYAAALFIVAGIGLEDIYLMATPLHSQNFVDLDDGILTNNRRLVTKNMWFNGTALSAQARRALENERVTMVAHASGCIHTVYAQASIDPKVYDHFSKRLSTYLKTSITDSLLGNFLRQDHAVQKCFQVRWSAHGCNRYIAAERVFAYEHGSPYRINDNTRDRLMNEIEMSEFHPGILPSRIVLNDLEDFLRTNPIDICQPEEVQRLKKHFASDCLSAEIAIDNLTQFCRVRPQLPDTDKKTFRPDPAPLAIDTEMSREEIATRLNDIRTQNTTAAMAFYAYRDLTLTESDPFLVAALQRNPVSIEGARQLSTAAVLEKISALPEVSIYDEAGRLAQPDEVWNYGRGDGLEKALLLANILGSRHPGENLSIHIQPNHVCLEAGNVTHDFASAKSLPTQTWEGLVRSI